MYAAKQVFFYVRIDGYHSLDLSMIITGVKWLADVFDNDPDLFIAFMATAFPQAFIAAVGAYADQIDYEFDVPPEIRATIASGK